MTEAEKYVDYLKMLKKPFQKLCRLRFLQPDGSTAFTLDNQSRGENAGAFISDGNITHTFQNGRRTNASVTISNVDGDYDYNYNTVWFGREVALDEGLILSDGETEFYIQQGVFLIEEPEETVQPNNRTVEYNLVDKVAALDGSLGGNLEGTYQVDAGTNIFAPIAALLLEDRGNGYSIDSVTPVFTNYYNDMTQTLQDGSVVNMTDSPYTLTVEAGQTKWDVILGLAAMLNAYVGYDETGALRLDPSQDDLLDTDKPIQWDFSTDEAELLGLAYTVKNTDVYNDIIVVGEAATNNAQPKARAQIFDGRIPTNINAIGYKTQYISQAGFATVTQCVDYAEWTVKRSSILQRAVNISCSQMFHIRGNELVTICRTDKDGSPIERHLVQGFSRPLAYNGPMTLTATSVQDFATTTITYTNEEKYYIRLYSANTFSLYAGGGQTWDGAIDFSLDDGSTWTQWAGGSITCDSTHYSICLRGVSNYYITSTNGDFSNVSYNNRFVLTGSDIYCTGNIENLLDYTTVSNGGHPSPGPYAFAYLFAGNTNLIQPPSIGCTDENLYGIDGAFFCMFYGCTGLAMLPAIYLLYFMYNGTYGIGTCTAMFEGCTSIKLSETYSSEYNRTYRLPKSGTATGSADGLSAMFASTGGTFTGTPAMNTTYYTANQIVY